ncbi:hypothetical protein A0256_19025 [Mucilaginibacter sp. PAMC 26640]|nr:hypothetical protein A0256_19025 [Mucilaginibacter sp. PAMC 26640]
MGNKVLVIEDEPIIGEMMCILLEMQGYKVISLSNTGLARRQLASKDIALVMLDLNLGGEDGQSMCRYIKENPDLQHIPVVLVSANANLEQIASECGADDFIAKPFDLQHFVQKIDHHAGAKSKSLMSA